ncbi:MAG: 4-alpha-glucanotransferase [Bacteroidetes bacterium GWF2_41_61]|jgi:glycosyltransferase involved in cell wall biosynthesis|nr:MAG: 4-alpha-glucanotransferase [Bacteroidetes bacterium GWE2_40_15]OFY26658.1 MAG: 4-alpha-glucanotransferase [Bacteroidetes bacterium GWF2_41_61]PKP05833.1 MAG: 4-alpha-glucanotransferase [Bacteroidetes bacterium HGW-Bacteroidetes-5]HBZ24908.1 4-alpha-glucanotransferase [Rikenellaceae bacterium]
MKVLMFGWEFPPHISGGLGTACYGLTKGLANNGVEVLFVMPSATGDEDKSAVSIIDASEIEVSESCRNVRDFLEKVQFIRIGSNLIPYMDPQEFTEMLSNLQQGQIEEFKLGFGQKYKFSGKYGKTLMEEVVRYALVGAEIALRNDFDVIHAHDWLTYLAGVAAKRVSGKPLVVHMHATEFDRSGNNINTEVFDIEKMGMREADRVVAVSHLTRNIILNKYGINPEKVVTVHNAVDFQGFEHLQIDRGVPEKIVTFLGRITYQKGPEYFIEAANKVIKRYPNVRFVMAGNGDLLNRCIRRVAKLGIAHKFHFTGFLRGGEVKQMFAYSDVYVMPSVSEPFGISPLEAMRSNVPTIISKQSGVAEVLRHAIKVDFWDIDAMADSIYALLSYPALSAMSVKHGLNEVNSLKWDAAAYRVSEIYSAIIKK